MGIEEKAIDLKSIRLNLEILKIKNLIDEKNFNQGIKDRLNEYLFMVDEQGNLQLNKSLIDYNFSKYDILNIIGDFLNKIEDANDFNFLVENLNNQFYETYLDISFPDINSIGSKEDMEESDIVDFILDEQSICDIISKIPISEFNTKDIDSDLIGELHDFVQIPIFTFITGELDDLEVSKLLNKIEYDINFNGMSGEVSDIMDFYFDNYNLLKKQVSLNHFLNEYIKSHSFNSISRDYDYEIIINSVNRVRAEIYSDKTMDRNKVMLKLKDYLKKEKIKISHISLLEKYKLKANFISRKYNLSNVEVNEIFDQATAELHENNVSDDICSHLTNMFELKVELNQSESRIKLNNVIKSEKIREKLKFDESDLEKVSEEIGRLIHRNEIRSHEITEKLIIEKLREIVYGIY